MSVVNSVISSLSADGWGCVLCLLVVWPEASQDWSLQAIGWGQVLVRKVTTSRRAHTNEVLLGTTVASVFASTVSHKRPPHTSKYVWLRHFWGHFFLSWFLVYWRPCVYPPRVEFLLPSVIWNSCDQTLWASKPETPRPPLPMLDPRAGDPDVGLKIFIPVGELLWWNYFLLCRLPTQHVWDLISQDCALRTISLWFPYFGM